MTIVLGALFISACSKKEPTMEISNLPLTADKNGKVIIQGEVENMPSNSSISINEQELQTQLYSNNFTVSYNLESPEQKEIKIKIFKDKKEVEKSEKVDTSEYKNKVDKTNEYLAKAEKEKEEKQRQKEEDEKVYVLDSPANVEAMFKRDLGDNYISSNFESGKISVKSKRAGLGLTKKGAKKGVLNQIVYILKDIKNSDYSPISEVSITIMAEVQDIYGNDSEQDVVTAIFSKDTIDKINPNNVDVNNLPILADKWEELVNITD